MTIKKTLLQIVQSILSDMDSEDVNSLSDTVEAMQIASVVEDVFYELAATRHVPEHSELMQLDALSDSSYPSHFKYPANTRAVDGIWYDVSSDGTFQYREVKYKEPHFFLALVDNRATDTSVDVLDKNGSTNLRIYSDRQPHYYTSFDDEYIIFDSYDATIDTTLQASKTRALAVKIPTFSQTDTYVPDVDEEFHPYLLAESKSRAMSLFKGGPDPKVEQAARRQKSYIQNDRYKTKMENKRPMYGRR